MIIMRDRRIGLFHILPLMLVLATYKTIWSPNWTTYTHNVRVFVISNDNCEYFSAKIIKMATFQARSQDFCVGGRFEQKVDLFLLFFLSVRGGGGCGSMLNRLCF